MNNNKKKHCNIKLKYSDCINIAEKIWDKLVEKEISNIRTQFSNNWSCPFNVKGLKNNAVGNELNSLEKTIEALKKLDDTSTGNIKNMGIYYFEFSLPGLPSPEKEDFYTEINKWWTKSIKEIPKVAKKNSIGKIPKVVKKSVDAYSSCNSKDKNNPLYLALYLGKSENLYQRIVVEHLALDKNVSKSTSALKLSKHNETEAMFQFTYAHLSEELKNFKYNSFLLAILEKKLQEEKNPFVGRNS